MYIFELIKPGTWLAGEDREFNWKIQKILTDLESCFYEANTSLNLFQHQLEQQNAYYNSELNPTFDKEKWQCELNREREIEDNICRKTGLNSFTDREEVRFLVSTQIKKEKWENGNMPRDLFSPIILIYAKSFIYALDTIEKFLRGLKQIEGTPEQCNEIHTQMIQSFPTLTKIRNTTQHIDERSQGIGTNGKKMKLHPIESDFIKSDGETLVLSSLFGNKFGCTLGNGHYGEIEVSPESLVKLRDIIQLTFDSFTWIGPKQHLPN